jgi:hypothetical protein
MDYQVALSPELGLSPQEFVASWNALPAAREQAEARLEQSTATTYNPDLLVPILDVASGIVLGMAGNAFYDVLKQIVLKPEHHMRKVHIERHEEADGRKVLIIDLEEPAE